MARTWLALTCFPLLAALVAAAEPPAPRPKGPPAIAREFRGVWVATVGNIDWPSKPGLSADEQKAELLAMLDGFKALNFNAVVLQIRPMCDALYESKLEPWSEYLTGESGKSPGYDPLAFAVEQAHKRGLELHAWFNPYRAQSPTAKSKLAASHVVNARPDIAKKYGKHHWLNPTHPDTQAHSLAVVADVVKRYDLDGVHMDDYFYPYPELDATKKEIPFPDDDTWATYQKAGGKLGRDDWRREAVNQFVRKLYEQTKAAKPHVKVGISPFGIWKSGTPEGTSGFDQYGKLYADAKLWFNKGWVDYFTPQLYWPIAQEKQSYPKLLAWWATQNTEKRHLWPGNYSSRATMEKGWPASEVAEQVKLTRKQAGAGGNVMFSARPLLKSEALRGVFKELYAEPALVPASPWLGDKKPGKVTDDLRADKRRLSAYLAGADDATLIVVQTRTKDVWQTTIVPVIRDAAGQMQTPLPGGLREEIIATPVSRTGVAGETAEVAFYP